MNLSSPQRPQKGTMYHLFYTFRVIYKIYYFFFFASSLALLFPVFYYLLSNPKNFSKAFSLMRFHASVLLLFAGVRLKVTGKGNIPRNGAYIICPNHTSFLDTFCIYSLFRQYFVFIGKKEIEKWPLFHIFYTSGMNILVDRDSRAGSVKAMKRMLKEISEGNPLVIFPEGTISKATPRLGPFKTGAFAIAIQKQVPVLPVTFVNNWKRLRRGGIWKGEAGPGISEIIIHEPIMTAGLKKEHVDQLKHRVENIINSSLSKWHAD